MTRRATKNLSTQPRARIVAQTGKKAGSAVFLAVLKHARVPTPVPEYRFDASGEQRKWRFDWAWPAARVALEVQGGIWMRGKVLGAHAMPTNIQRDHEKFSAAACQGWRILYVEPRQLATPSTAGLIRKALAWKELPAAPPPDTQTNPVDASERR